MERKVTDFACEDLVCAITYLVGVIDRLSEKETSIKCDSFIKSVHDKIGEVYELNVDKPKWIPSTEHPAIDEEVIALVGEENMISFAHIVDKERCIDYDGWNIPDVKCWIPCPKIEED